MRIRLDRLFAYPTARVLARDGDVTLVCIEGLVCDRMCAARSRAALRRLDGVRDVRIDFGTGIARIEGEQHDDAAYSRAIDAVVASKPLRRLIGRVGSHAERARCHSERSEESLRRTHGKPLRRLMGGYHAERDCCHSERSEESLRRTPVHHSLAQHAVHDREVPA